MNFYPHRVLVKILAKMHGLLKNEEGNRDMFDVRLKGLLQSRSVNTGPPDGSDIFMQLAALGQINQCRIFLVAR